MYFFLFNQTNYSLPRHMSYRVFRFNINDYKTACHDMAIGMILHFFNLIRHTDE